MKSIIDAQHFNCRQMKIINAMRMYLNVVYTSEISNIEGNKIRLQIYEGRRDDIYTPHESIIQQPHPGKKGIRLWKRAMQLLLQPRTLHWKHYLGEWTQHHSSRGNWRSYWILDTNTFLHKKQVHVKNGSRIIP